MDSKTAMQKIITALSEKGTPPASTELAWALSARLLDDYEVDADVVQALADTLSKDRSAMQILWDNGVIEGDYFDV